jgi:hypothetical protein
MPTQEIARDEWPDFFDSFSRRHQGWIVAVEVFGTDIGAQVEAREMPLQGITAEMQRSGEEIISIMVGDTPEDHVTHTIASPTRVNIKRSEEGADEAVEIESAGGSSTLIRFRSPMPAEMVDGIL